MTKQQGTEKSARRLIAAFECATPAGGVALADPSGAVIAERWTVRKPAVSHQLLADLHSVMEETGVKRSDITAVAVSRGPGSFTGIRVGLAVAKTLAQAWRCPLHTFSTLEGLAWRLLFEAETVCPLLDARRGELYRGWYHIGDHGRFGPLREDGVMPLESVLAEAREYNTHTIHFTGDAAAMHADEIRAALGERAVFAPEELMLPAAGGLARGAAARIRAGLKGDSPLSVAPTYLRLSDAEKNLAAREEK